MTRAAWFCPSCQKHHAPHVETCPGLADAISDKTMPVGPGAIPTYPAPTIWRPETADAPWVPYWPNTSSPGGYNPAHDPDKIIVVMN